MIDFRLRTFVVACETMNYTRAAEKLHITQPAVSQHIKYLEKHYNQTFFVLEGKKLVLTPAGKQLYKAAVTLLNDEVFLREQMRNVTKQNFELRLGVTLTIGEFVLPGKLHKILKKYPNVNLKILIENTDLLLEKLANKDIHFALLEGNFNKSEYEHFTYSTERFIPVCSTNHVFTKEPTSIKDLFPERLLVREDGSGTKNILKDHLSTSNLSITDFERTIEVNSMSAIKNLCIQDAGITFLYEAAVQEEIKKGILKEIVLNDFSIHHDFTFIWNKNSVFDQEYKDICELLTK